MRRNQTIPFPNANEARNPRRWAALGFAGFLNVGLIYALATGLAARFVEKIPSVIHAEVVKQPPVVRHEVPPPPPPEFAAPKVPQIPVPQVHIARPAPAPHAITAVAVPKPMMAPPKPAPIAPVIPPVPAHAVAGTHTIPPYPPVARRLGEEGTVQLRIAIDASGAIRGVDIVKTSGHDRLDQAAANWVAHHWRYRPATKDGKPVASSVLADVKFDLRSS